MKLATDQASEHATAELDSIAGVSPMPVVHTDGVFLHGKAHRLDADCDDELAVLARCSGFEGRILLLPRVPALPMLWVRKAITRRNDPAGSGQSGRRQQAVSLRALRAAAAPRSLPASLPPARLNGALIRPGLNSAVRRELTKSSHRELVTRPRVMRVPEVGSSRDEVI